MSSFFHLPLGLELYALRVISSKTDSLSVQLSDLFRYAQREVVNDRTREGCLWVKHQPD